MGDGCTCGGEAVKAMYGVMPDCPVHAFKPPQVAAPPAVQGGGGLACYCTTVDDGIGGTATLPGDCPQHDAQRAVGLIMADLYGSNSDPQVPRLPEVREALLAAFSAGLAAFPAPGGGLDREAAMRRKVRALIVTNGLLLDHVDPGVLEAVAADLIAALAPLLTGGERDG